LFTRNQAITAMVLAERLGAGYGHDVFRATSALLSS